MKTINAILCLALFAVACQPKPDTTADDLFKKNSETALSYLKAWESENVDYSIFADDYVSRETGFGSEVDSIGLAEAKEWNSKMLAQYDFKMMGDPVFLPGVNPDTKKPDGSVRYYGDWEIILPATDSTEARSAVLKAYHSFDFNAEGKLAYEQMYGDFTGVMMYLHKPAEEPMAAEE